MRLQLKLVKGETKLIFRSPKYISHLSLHRVEVKWTYYNVEDGEILVDSTKTDLPTGYYSFDDLKSELEKVSAVVTLEKSGKVMITPPAGKTLNLGNIGPLLGFHENDALTSETTSPAIVNVHGGLDQILVSCDRVDTLQNYENGLRSENCFKLLVPNQALWGTTSAHALEFDIPLEKTQISSITFKVEDYSFLTDKDSYTLFLDCDLS